MRISEENFRILVESQPAIIVIVQGEYLVYANPYTAELTGYTRDELNTLPFIEFIHPDDHDFISSRAKSRMKGEHLQSRFELKIRTKSGESRWVDTFEVLIEYEKKSAILVTAFDVTDRKKSEEALRNLQKLESLGILAGGIAHDFNNLLGGIYGNIDMALESAENDTTSLYLSITIATIERARALTQQLLTFAKGGAPVQEIAPLIPFLFEVTQFALSGSNISCNFNIQQDLWHCNYDRNQLVRLSTTLS